MASLGKKSAFAFPLGGDVSSNGSSNPSSYVFKIANSPVGIRFANLPLQYRGDKDLEIGISRSYSSIVIVSQKTSDKSDISGVIRNKNWRPRRSFIFKG